MRDAERDTGRPLLRALLSLGTTLLLPGCMSGAAFIAEHAPPAASIHTVLIVPMNAGGDPAPPYVSGAQELERDVVAYVEATGREAERVSSFEVEQRLHAIATPSGEGDDAARAERIRSELARRLAADHPADVIAMPALRVRQGNYTGRMLLWDGASRAVPIETDGNATMEVHSIAGKGLGTSLRMTILTPDGTRVFERYVGLEPIEQYRMSGVGTVGGVSIQGSHRNDLFRDRELLEEAVTRSFEPLLEPPRAE